MKTFRIIQKIAAAIAIVIALGLSDGSDATTKEIGIAFLIVSLAILMLLSEHFYTLKNK